MGTKSSGRTEPKWNVSMIGKTVPKQDSYRSSKTGKFVTERYADKHPNTTEHERIKHPERK